MAADPFTINEARPSRPALPEITLEMLTLDETLDDITRISRYCTAAVPVQRLVHVKLMGPTAPVVGCVARPFAF